MMRHKFYIPLGIPMFSAPPPGAQPGDMYFDTTTNKVVTYTTNNTWVTNAAEFTAGAGLVDEQQPNVGRVIKVITGWGMTITGGKVVANQIDLDARYGQVRTMTQAQYDATSPKDPAILYVIV
jgi:hypothetical protein